MNNTSKKLLIIEDDKLLLRALLDSFTIEGLEVIVAKDGGEGLEKALEQHPDLILLDILMPKMNGMEMLKKLRKDSWGKSVQIIMLTNLSDKEKISEAVTEGISEYLVKSDTKIGYIVDRVKEKLQLK